MKKSVSIVMMLLTLCLTMSLSTVSAVEVSNYELKSNEIVVSHEKVQSVDDDGNVKEVGLASYEQQPLDFAINSNGCTTGNHLNVVSNGATDVTRIHRDSHPNWCTVEYTYYWKCTNCHTTGKDVRDELVWCPSKDTNDSIVEVE
ncbi:MAG: hypothetical protein ACI4WH_06930 [Oscillospiraceae bacterium]